MTAPSRAREGEPILFGAPPGREYQDELPPCELAPDAKGVFKAPSVTTVLKAGLPTKWAIRNWDRTTIAERAVDNPQAWANMRMPDGSFDRKGAIEYLASAPERSMGQAADRGTDVHTVLEAMAKGQPIPAIGPGREPWVRAVRQFWVDFRPQPVWVEVSVYHRGFDAIEGYEAIEPYAGTLDLIAWLPTGPNGEWELWLIDLKTGKGVYGDMAYQQMAYAWAQYGIVRPGGSMGDDGKVAASGWVRAEIPKVHRMGILNARAVGTYDLVPLMERAGEPSPEMASQAWSQFNLAQRVWAGLAKERELVAPPVPVQGRLETTLYASWLVQRYSIIWNQGGQQAIALLAGAWPRGVPGIPDADKWTQQECMAVDEVMTWVEAEHVLEFTPPPAQRTLEVVADPEPVDPFEGLPKLDKPDPLTTAATEARTPEQEAHHQAQLERLKAAGVGAGEEGRSAPGAYRSEVTGLTERDAELFGQYREQIGWALSEFPIDLQRKLDGWAQREGHPNVKLIKASVEGLNQLRTIRGMVAEVDREWNERTERVQRMAQAISPDSPDLWTHLQAMAVTGDGMVVTVAGMEGWAPELMTYSQCAIFGYLAVAMQRLVLFMTAHGEDASEVRVDVNQVAAEKLLAPLGSATELRKVAKETAIKFGLNIRPASKAAILADPILVSLLLPAEGA